MMRKLGLLGKKMDKWKNLVKAFEILPPILDRGDIMGP